MVKTLSVIVLSGAEDGRTHTFLQGHEGYESEDSWSLSVGRRNDNDLCLQFDTFASRQHAKLHWKNKQWWLEDCNTVNGTFLENTSDFFSEERIKGIIPIQEGELFRIGRTWLRIQPNE